MIGKHVLVTTGKRGVFFGKLQEDNGTHSVVLDGAQLCVYWSARTRGFLGLASIGPQAGSKVSAPHSEPSKLYDVTSLTVCSEKAVEQWKSAPWS